MRLDKYLWSVRLYKTRSLAADACQCGKVTMSTDGRELKPSGRASALALLVMLATALIIWAYMKVTKYEL